MSDLHQDLLAAHDAGDTAALVALYEKAADGAPTDDATAFFLTHAYVFALECGHANASALRTRLVALNSEPSDKVPKRS